MNEEVVGKVDLPSTSEMFDSFTEFTKDVGDGISIYGRQGGNGPPLLLLHG